MSDTDVHTSEELHAYDAFIDESPPASSPSLGFTWTATGLAGFVGKNLASGVVGAIGGKAFGAALDAIGLGEPNLAAMLEDISNRLIVVEKTVQEIKQLVLQLLQELAAFRSEMDQSFLELQIADAFAKIDAAYGTPVARLGETPTGEPGLEAGETAPSLMELLTSLPKTKTAAQLKGYAAAFVQAEGQQWNILTQIQVIHNVLTTDVGKGSTLLNRWTTGLLLQMQQKKINLTPAYATLESYFLQAIAKQLTAVSIHCVALGSDASRLDYFIRTDFGPKMQRQTAEFLRCTERLVLGSMHMIKVPSTFTVEQSGEFPGEMEPIFLRADLLCAGLNLVSNKRESASPKAAIAGIYGRSLARRSDLNAQREGPEIRLPGFSASRGAVGPVVSELHAVDLYRDGTDLVLRDYTDSSPNVVRYFWPWPATLPAQGVPIDPRMRGGVRPAYYDVFTDKDWPLAAGFVDFGRLLAGAPADAPSKLVTNTQFPDAGPHSVINQKPFVPSQSHPLVRPTPGGNRIAWRFDHSWPADGTWLRSSAFHLFRYAGKKARMRLTANVVCQVEHHKGSPTWGDNDVNARVSLIKQSGPTNTFYNSEGEGGGVLFLIHRRGFYKRELESWPAAEFEVSDGTYLLSLEFKSWIGNRTIFESFNGWDFDSLQFDLNGTFVEWI